MEHLYKLKDALMDSLEELDTIKNGKLKMNELEALNYITDTIKNIDKIFMLEDEDGGYSGAGAWEAHINGDYGNSRRNDHRYDNKSSYANRGKHYVRGHYSRADGKEHMISKLEDMLDDVDNDRVKSAIHKVITELEKG